MRGPPERPRVEATCGRLTNVWWNICLLCWERDPLSRPTMSVIVNKVDQIMQILVYLVCLFNFRLTPFFVACPRISFPT